MQAGYGSRKAYVHEVRRDLEMSEKRNIQYIVNNALCTACGACSGICPAKAVDMVENTAGFIIARVDNEKCTACGICLEVCPSNKENDISLACKDIFHGVCLEGYVGFAKDKKIRQKSQSGGIVTALLCYLLDHHFVDSAVINNFDKETRRPQAVLAESKRDIVSGCGSYYTQTSVVKKILENSNSQQLAAVVLGCQAQSLNLIKAKYPKVKLPLYTIGLFCAGQNSGFMIDDLIKLSGCDSDINRECVCNLRFRDKNNGGWPGNVSIFSDKNSYTLPKEKRFFLKSLYELHRCISCFDQMNIFSDIVCGDPWHIANKQQPEGHTVVIARTEKGKNLLEYAVRDGAIELEHLPVEDIIRGQTVDGRHKTKFFTAKSIYIENGWMFPYDEKLFAKDAYVSADKKEKATIKERLEYSRKLYRENEALKVRKMIAGKKRSIQKEALVSYPLRLVKRGLRFLKNLPKKIKKKYQ